MESAEHIVIFDGVCNFCNSSVNFIIRHDKKNDFRFAMFQSTAGARILSESKVPQGYFGSVVYVSNGDAYYKSTAVLKILRQLGRGYQLLYALIIIPRFIRDFCYDLVGNNRYKLFGKRETCIVPDPALKEKFL